MGRHRNYGGAGPIIPFPEDAMLQKSTIFSSADVLTMKTTPLELVPAPGANRVLVPIALQVHLQFNSIAYVQPGAFILSLGAPGGANSLNLGDNNPLTQASDHCAQYDAASLFNWSDSLANTANKPLKLSVNVSDPTTGNSTLMVTIFYAVAPTS